MNDGPASGESAACLQVLRAVFVASGPVGGRRAQRAWVKPVLLAAVSVAALACGTPARPAAPDATASQAVEALRDATRAFQDVAAALRAGYAADVADCIVHEHHGAMGYHHINQSYIERDISVARPQLLLYERLPDGTYRLNGVEFFIPYSLWPRDSAPPVILHRGRVDKASYFG